MNIENPQSAAAEPQFVDVAANIQVVQQHIESAARNAARMADDVTLIAVSKTHDTGRIVPALDAGQRVFGENRVQEAAEKWPALQESHADVELHLIGPLQTNKVKSAISLFDVIQTVDRPKLARVLAEEMARSGVQRECFVEVNVGEEPQKTGILPKEADIFISECRDQYQLPVRGVMCIPPFDQEPSPYFALLAKIAARNELPVISMGMSSDYEVAVAFGATHVRVGTAIFGPRQTY